MSSKTDLINATEWVRGPPPSQSVWERIGTAIYNPREKSFLGRTAKRWGIVFAFYLVFYSALALLFAVCMGGLFLTLDKSKPMYTLEHSLIGTNPGVAHRPRPTRGFLMRYGRENQTQYDTFIDELNDFLQPYENDTWYAANEGCSADESYGFPDTPCFIIKLNRIYNWKPEYYDDVNNKLPEDMPQDLMEHIRSLEPAQRAQVWLSCWDEDNSTSIQYPWGRGLPGRFYPFLSSPNYKSPLLAVRLTPSVNTLAVVRCRAWAKNIVYNKSMKDPSGYTRIQVYVEDSSLNVTDSETA